MKTNVVKPHRSQKERARSFQPSLEKIPAVVPHLRPDRSRRGPKGSELGTFDIKNDLLHFLYKVNNLFLHQSYLKIPLPVKLT